MISIDTSAGNNPELEALFEEDGTKPVLPEVKKSTDKVDEDMRAPSGAELERYRQLLELTRMLGRAPTAEEGFPIMRTSARLRGKTWVGKAIEPKDHPDNATRADKGAVRRAMRRLIRSVAAWLSNAERVAERKADLAERAMDVVHECLSRDSRWEGKELEVRSKLAISVLRVCGLSEEPTRGRGGGGGGDTHTHVNLNMGGRDKGEAGETEVERLRRIIYDNRMAQRQ